MSLELNKIHCGDNCDLLGKMPRASVDLVVTSPPYDDLRTYGGHSWDFFGVAWHLKRVLKPGGVIVWVVADATKDGSETGTSMEQALHFKRLGLNLHDTMIWSKGGFTGVGSLQCRYGPSTEFMFVFSNGRPATFNPIKDRKNKWEGEQRKHRMVRLPSGEMLKKTHDIQPLGEYGIRFNVWDINPEQNEHPAPFPYTLAADHIASWSNPGDLVLDPFSGSGTTAKAAKELGRAFIGLEVNPGYVRLAEQRIAQETLGLDVV